MTRAHCNYCLECEWSASERELSRGALAMAAIEHAVEVGHDIDSERLPVGDHNNGHHDVHGGYDSRDHDGRNGHDHYNDSDGDDPETVILFWDE